MADVIIENTQLGVTKATLISSLVQKELAFNAMLLPTVTDVSAFAKKGSKTIAFPKLTSFAVSNRAEGVKGEAVAVTATNDSLNLDINAYVSWIIDAFTAQQTTIDSQIATLKLAASAQGRYVDEQIILKLAAIAASFENVGADANITYANIVSMRKKILKADGNLANAVLIASVEQEAAIMSLTEFKDASVFGQANIPSGVIGKILGMPVMIHNGLADKQAFVYEKSGLALGFQKGASYGSQPEIGYGVGAERSAVDQFFGLAGMQLALKGAAAGKSPLVIGLND